MSTTYPSRTRSMMFPTPPDRIRNPAATPRGCRTIRRSRTTATAITMTEVTATSSQRIPEKLDQAAP